MKQKKRKDCRQHMLKELEQINNSEFNEFLINRITLTNELQEKFKRKFGVSNETKKA